MPQQLKKVGAKYIKQKQVRLCASGDSFNQHTSFLVNMNAEDWRMSQLA